MDDSPEEKGHDRYLREMWGDHPLSRKITGEVEEVQRIVRDRPGALLPRAAGARKTPSSRLPATSIRRRRSRDLAAAVFPSADRGRGPGEAHHRRLEAGKSPFVPDRFNQVQIYAGTCYPLDHELAHYYTSLVFSTAFGESMSCRLFQRLREELGLCYTVYSFRSFFSDIGMWTIYANATPGQVRAVPGRAGRGAGPAPRRSPSAARRSRTRRATLREA